MRFRFALGMPTLERKASFFAVREIVKQGNAIGLGPDAYFSRIL